MRVALAAIDGPKSAVVGLTGRLYFNANRDIPRPIRMGFFRYGRFVTAPLQLVRIDQPNGIDLAAEHEKGHVVTFRTGTTGFSVSFIPASTSFASAGST